MGVLLISADSRVSSVLEQIRRGMFGRFSVIKVMLTSHRPRRGRLVRKVPIMDGVSAMTRCVRAE